MQFDGDGVAVCIIKINSQLKCAGILDSPSRLRCREILLGTGMWMDMWINRRSYSGGRRLQVCEMVIPIS